MIEHLYLKNIAANSVVDFMKDAATGESKVRFIGRPSIVTYAAIADAVGLELEVHSGDRKVVSRSTLDAGGTDGVFPNMNEKAAQFAAAAGEVLEFQVRETAGVATTDAMLSIDVTPIA